MGLIGYIGERPSRLPGRLLLFLLVLTAGLGCRASDAQQGGDGPPGEARRADIAYIGSDPETGTSQATVVDDVPLAHTDQFFPLDASGELVEGGAAEQIDRVVEHLRRALSAAGTRLDDVVKVNVYAARSDVVEQVKKQLAETFSGEAKPAVAYVVGRLPLEGALVAMDAVAAAPARGGGAQTPAIHAVEGLYGPEAQGDVAVMPRGEKVYISGQAEDAEDLMDAVRGTMESLHATLAYLGLSAEDVVQVKAFLQPIEQAREAERVITEYYRDTPGPPVVSVEWLHSGFPTEIELVASGGAASKGQAEGEAVSFDTPPGLSQASTFSRLARVHRGDLVFTSGLYGPCAQGAEQQVRALFDELGGVLEKTNADFEHLVKATYYYTTEAASQQLNAIRPEFYNPERPPAASKVVVRGVGREGCSVTTDMIAVSPEK